MGNPALHWTQRLFPRAKWTEFFIGFEQNILFLKRKSLKYIFFQHILDDLQKNTLKNKIQNKNSITEKECIILYHSKKLSFD